MSDFPAFKSSLVSHEDISYLKGRIAALEAALRKYGDHERVCYYRNVGCDPSVRVCICGWDEAKKLPTALETKDE